jgi:hypothetical protein
MMTRFSDDFGVMKIAGGIGVISSGQAYNDYASFIVSVALLVIHGSIPSILCPSSISTGGIPIPRTVVAMPPFRSHDR